MDATFDTTSPGALPDFLVIGAQRSGTTYFHSLLCRHPRIVGAKRKETHFFDRTYAKGEAQYRSLFEQSGEAEGRPEVRGEATPYYLFHPEVPARAAGMAPRAKLIALLRNPVDRAYSHYHLQRRRGAEPLDTFEEAVAAERGRLAAERREMGEAAFDGFAHRKFSYLSRSCYEPQLRRWHRFFPSERMLVIQSEKFYEEPEKAIVLAQKHVGVEPRPHVPADVSHRSGNEGDYAPMDPSLRATLARHFEPYNQALYQLLGEDFGWE